MKIINNNMKWIMIVSGLITCSMFYVVVAPEAGLINTFGASISGPLAEIVARSWGTVITLTGGMLIYAALKPVHRPLVLIVACISKAMFVGLILVYGAQFMDKAIVPVIFDSTIVVIFILYLLTSEPAK